MLRRTFPASKSFISRIKLNIQPSVHPFKKPISRSYTSCKERTSDVLETCIDALEDGACLGALLGGVAGGLTGGFAMASEEPCILVKPFAFGGGAFFGGIAGGIYGGVSGAVIGPFCALALSYPRTAAATATAALFVNSGCTLFSKFTKKDLTADSVIPESSALKVKKP